MVRTRQSARLEAARQAKITPSQDKVVEEDHVSSHEQERESSSGVAEGELADSEEVDKIHEEIRLQPSDDEERERLPEVLTLESCEATTRASAISSRSREKAAMDKSSEVTSRLDPGADMMGQLYLNYDLESVLGGRGKAWPLDSRGRDPHHELMKKSVITPDFEKREAAPPISQPRYVTQKTKKVSGRGGWKGTRQNLSCLNG